MLLVVALGVYAWRREYIVLLYATTLLPSVTFFVYVIASALTDTPGNNTGLVDQYDIFAYTVVAIHIALSILLFYSEVLSRAKGTLLFSYVYSCSDLAVCNSSFSCFYI